VYDIVEMGVGCRQEKAYTAYVKRHKKKKAYRKNTVVQHGEETTEKAYTAYVKRHKKKRHTKKTQ
jgi:hypothetical protein